MKFVLPQYYVTLTDWTGFGSTAAVCNVSVIIKPFHLVFAVVATFWPLQTVLLMAFHFGLGECLRAPFTGRLLMELLIMLLLIVYIYEIPAMRTPSNVPLAVGIVTVHLRLRKEFQAILAMLQLLLIHRGYLII